jgi:hypothetical protein
MQCISVRMAYELVHPRTNTKCGGWCKDHLYYFVCLTEPEWLIDLISNGQDSVTIYRCADRPIE